MGKHHLNTAGRWLAAALIGMALLGLAYSQATPEASAAPVAPGLSVAVNPTVYVPAQAGYAQVSGGYPLRVEIALDGKALDVYWTGSAYMALIAFPYDAEPGEHTLTITAADPITGESAEAKAILTVEGFNYPFESVALPQRLLPLLDPTLNQTEMGRLRSIYSARTRPLTWDWPFAVPVPGGVMTSRFGGARSYNGGLWLGVHTGADFRRDVGEPVSATADGRVVVAEYFDIRGNVIILDHGYGVFSQYAHLAEFYVRPGDVVRQGQIIGAAGNTGRSNGPHLHFEIIVNGVEVDPLRWLALNPDFIPPREVNPETDADRDGIPDDQEDPGAGGTPLPPPDPPGSPGGGNGD